MEKKYAIYGFHVRLGLNLVELKAAHIKWPQAGALENVPTAQSCFDLNASKNQKYSGT